MAGVQGGGGEVTWFMVRDFFWGETEERKRRVKQHLLLLEASVASDTFCPLHPFQVPLHLRTTDCRADATFLRQ